MLCTLDKRRGSAATSERPWQLEVQVVYRSNQYASHTLRPLRPRCASCYESYCAVLHTKDLLCCQIGLRAHFSSRFNPKCGRLGRNCWVWHWTIGRDFARCQPGQNASCSGTTPWMCDRRRRLDLPLTWNLSSTKRRKRRLTPSRAACQRRDSRKSAPEPRHPSMRSCCHHAKRRGSKSTRS